MLAGALPVPCAAHEALCVWAGTHTALVCTGVDGDPDQLWPGEMSAVSRAVPRRQREFAAGREAARAGMRILGLSECAVPARADRSPVWPDGLAGSISHSPTRCVVVLIPTVHAASIGIDVEEDQGIEAALWSTICLPEELTSMAEQGLQDMARLVTRLFSAKEAYFKWQYPLTGEMLDFKDVSIRFSPDRATFEALRTSPPGKGVARRPVQGRQCSVDNRIFSLVRA